VPLGFGKSTPIYGRGVLAASGFTPNGKGIAVGRDDGTVEVLDVATTKAIDAPVRHGETRARAVFSPDGRVLLTLNKDARLWERATGRLLHTLADGHILVAAFSPDGRAVLTGNEEGAAQLWDVATGDRVGAGLVHAAPLAGVGFSADGGAVWTAARDNTARHWDRATGKPLRSLTTPAGLTVVIFSPTGLAALTYGEHRYTQFRDLKTWPDKGPLVAHPSPHWLRVTLSPDGLLASSAGSDRTTRLWDTATGKAIGMPYPSLRPLENAALRADGQMLAVGDDHGVHLWKLPLPVKGTPEQVRLWAELATGLELDEQGSAHELSAADQADRRRQWERLGEVPALP
jgi:WD40 repeat protein